ncbi:hypothetical protein K469DRAFT_727066 [Zopfia rhizophila CBS 207.26]|uniref:NAD(P)-binding protein n=1 Tax=Zopfia rhizophila CBS 207.26 TaxID=1314779 RepID=A0A6A6E1I8_9PEZI|nr:hypothetical protein K469DRAFT_727066 [Zopfia rhizophila CBS 207.26]
MTATIQQATISILRNPGPTKDKVISDALRNVHILPANLTDADSLTAAAKSTADLTGGVVDHLIVNGAYLAEQSMSFKPGDFVGKEQLLRDELRMSIDTNVTSVVYAINAFLPAEGVAYSISKAVVNVLVAKYAIQFKDDGIIFLALTPGIVYTKTEDFNTAPQEVRAIYDFMGAKLHKYEPSYKGPLTPKESVKMQLKVLDGLTIENSDDMLSHNGNKRWA